MTKTYFFDSYATIEVLRGNNTYWKYAMCNSVMTKLNVFEIYYYLLKEGDATLANKFIKNSENKVKEFSLFIVAEAVKLKLFYKNKNLSITDCLGYALAKSLGIPFLTGDKEFEDLPHVEFVK